MNSVEFRRWMDSYRLDVNEEAISLKDSMLVLDRLQALYWKLDQDERAMADQVLADWALSDDETVRFDALALINSIGITSALPGLRRLSERLVASRTPSAPYELKKVNRLIERLGAK